MQFTMLHPLRRRDFRRYGLDEQSRKAVEESAAFLMKHHGIDHGTAWQWLHDAVFNAPIDGRMLNSLYGVNLKLFEEMTFDEEARAQVAAAVEEKRRANPAYSADDLYHELKAAEARSIAR
jgi:hypothetical protein